MAEMTDPTTRTTAASEMVPGCNRLGHPTHYAHRHPYLSERCESGEHAVCAMVRGVLRWDNGCDCECHHAD